MHCIALRGIEKWENDDYQRVAPIIERESENIAEILKGALVRRSIDDIQRDYRCEGIKVSAMLDSKS